MALDKRAEKLAAALGKKTRSTKASAAMEGRDHDRAKVARRLCSTLSKQLELVFPGSVVARGKSGDREKRRRRIDAGPSIIDDFGDSGIDEDGNHDRRGVGASPRRHRTRRERSFK